MKWRCPEDRGGDRAIARGLLVGELRGVVALRKAIDADDLEGHQVGDPTPGSLPLEIVGRRGEELRRRSLLGRLRVRGIDHDVHSVQRGYQAVGASKIDAVGATQHVHFVATASGLAYDVASDHPGCPLRLRSATPPEVTT
jgi:hypothetical protein